MMILRRTAKPNSTNKNDCDSNVLPSSPTKVKRNALKQLFRNPHSYWFLFLAGFSIILIYQTCQSILETMALPMEKIDHPISTKQCKQYNHGDTSPTVNVTSIFNCNSPSGKCKWFYPSKFFNEYCGVGKEWSYQIDYMEEQRQKRNLWVNGPPIVLPWMSLNPDLNITENTGRQDPFPTHNLSMVHVHKTGGTSLVTAFGRVIRKNKARGKRRNIYMPPKDSKNNTEPIMVKMMKARNFSGDFLEGAVKYKHEDEWGETDHTLFAVIRDPAERFISSIGQATGGVGSKRNGVAEKLLEECGKSTGKETLRCFVDLMMHNGTWIEVHFTPMALEISFATMYKDIPVAVFPFKEVPTLLYELNVDPHEKKKDGKKRGHRANEILTNLSMDDYDDSILRDLCQVYKVDVLFLQHIGYDSRCDRFIKLKGK